MYFYGYKQCPNSMFVHSEVMSILIAEDHDLYRASLIQMIKAIYVNAKLFEATNGVEALQAIAENAIDIVLIDLNMPVKDGYELIEQLTLIPNRPKIVINSVAAFGTFIRVNFKEGNIEGYFVKSSSMEELYRGLQVIFEGGYYFAESLSYVIRKSDLDVWELVETSGVELTAQEQKVLLGICEQQANADIAKADGVSVHTIKTHRKNLKSKLKIQHNAGLVI
jgi:two-component system nitrate/nitrite response regulator NarL